MGRDVNGASKRRGMSLVDTAMALAVTGVALSGMIQLQSGANNQVKDSSTAQMLTEIGQAASQYIQANQAALIKATYSGGVFGIPVGRVSATQTPNAASVQAAGFLPSSFVDRDAWGHHHTLLIKYIPVSGLYPTGGIDGVIVSYGTPIKDPDLGAISAKIGAQGGFYPSKTVGTGVSSSWSGAYGSWSRPLSDFGLSGNGATLPDGTAFGSGTTAYTLAFSSAAPNDFLYRDYNGNNVYNTMNTALYMSGGGARQQIVGAGSVDAQSIGNSDGSNVLSLSSTYTYANNVTLASNAIASWSGTGASLKADTNWIYAVAQYGVAAAGYADISNGSYILRPASNSLLNNVTSNGTVTVATSTPSINTVIGGGNVTTTLAMKAQSVTATFSMLSPIYCGDATCNYYLNPDSNSYLSSLATAGDVTVGGNEGVTGDLTVNGAAHVNGQIWSDVGVYSPGGITAQGGLTAQSNGTAGSGGISADGGIASHKGTGTGSFNGKIFADSDIWSRFGNLYTPNLIVAGMATSPATGVTGNVFAYLDGNLGNVEAAHIIQVGQSGPDATNAAIVQGAACNVYGGIGANASSLFFCNGTWHKVTVN